MKIKTEYWKGPYGIDGYETSVETNEGKGSFRLNEGEPEDMIFGRNLEMYSSLHTMLKLAYEAGKNGESFKLIEKEAE